MCMYLPSLFAGKNPLSVLLVLYHQHNESSSLKCCPFLNKFKQLKNNNNMLYVLFRLRTDNFIVMQAQFEASVFLCGLVSKYLSHLIKNISKVIFMKIKIICTVL
ncbi:selenoprotein O [Platysternon megacephalum]|uniref:Selenoprotein O n=1 Tax=Platysternon megacephalum TaxID=55544 RepID=A0A4D9EXS3_9SAUR|nr:selenoprotein O [Platysternon megacephalum]